MADIADVLTCLRDVVTPVVYPNGTGQPSLTGKAVSVFPGWPIGQSLDTAIAAGKSMISIFPKAMEKNTTRYLRDQQVIAMPVSTITLTISGGTITLSGTITTPQNVGLLVNGQSYVHPVQASDTLTSIATALASAVAANVAGTVSSGPVITLGTPVNSVVARVGASGTVASEIKRQDRVIAITIWSPDQSDRDTLAGAIDVALTGINWITLPDGFQARVLYHNSLSDDGLQKANVYRRDLNYSVEYATTVTTQAPAVLFPVTTLGTKFSTATTSKTI